jgi:glycosyltransferase involved in cell wall biosynthesis
MDRGTEKIRMKLAVLFDMFGPYHLARLNALGATHPTLGIEIASRSTAYDWQPMEVETCFERRTLFDVKDSSELSATQINRAIAAELDRFCPDVVFVPGWTSRGALSMLRWNLTHGIPSVVMSESTRRDRIRHAWREAIKRQVVASFGAAFVGGDPHKEYLAELGMGRECITLGYDVVDNAYFSQAAKAVRADGQRLRAQLGLPERYVLASARFIPIKSLLGLIEAFARFRHLRPASQTHLVLLGDGPDRAALEARRARLGLDNAILMPGFQQYDRLPIYYSLADCFLHLSRNEPWGLVVNEAMAAGLPVIVSKACGCSTNLVEDGGNGYLVGHDDLDGIAERLSRIDDDPALRERMAHRSSAIIADWGPQRFVAGATQAASIARQSRVRPQNVRARLLLATLQTVAAR